MFVVHGTQFFKCGMITAVRMTAEVSLGRQSVQHLTGGCSRSGELEWDKADG